MITERRNCTVHPPAGGLFVDWQTTDYCNLTCNHCYAESSPHRPTDHDLPMTRMRAVAADMIEAGVTEVGLGGGEPFSRAGIDEVITTFQSGSCELMFVTNGYFLDQTMIDRIRSANIGMAYVSLDGHNPETTALLRGRSTAFDKAVTAIKALVAAGIPTGINHVLHAGNFQYFEQFCRLAISLRPRMITVSTFTPSGRGASNSVLELSPEQVAEASELANWLGALPGAEGLVLSFGAPDEATGQGAGFVCGAGFEHLQVRANGDVATCAYLASKDPRYTVGNLHHEPFAVLVERAREVMSPQAGHCPAFADAAEFAGVAQ